MVHAPVDIVDVCGEKCPEPRQSHHKTSPVTHSEHANRHAALTSPFLDHDAYFG